MTIANDADFVFHRDWTRQYPVASHARGIYVYDREGKRYIDAIGGVMVVNVGHHIEEITQSIVRQLNQFAFANTNWFSSDAEQVLARKLVELSFHKFSKVWISSSGSAANEMAIKLARAFHLCSGRPNKTKVVYRKFSYHGASLGALSLTGLPSARDTFDPYLLDFPIIDPPYCYRCPLNLTYPSCKVACAQELENVVSRIGPDNISAFILEPVSGTYLGALPSPNGYLRIIRDICDRHDIVLIMDEVVSGLGRTGKNFAYQHWDVEPDILTLGKGLAGGYLPAGAALVRDHIHRALETAEVTFNHAETFTGHAVICAAASSVIEYIEKHNLVERAHVIGQYFEQRLADLRALPIVGDIRGMGLLRGIELVTDKESKEPFAVDLEVGKKVANKAFARGLLIRPGKGAADGIRGDIISLAPPYIVTTTEIDEIVKILHGVLEDVAMDLKS